MQGMKILILDKAGKPANHGTILQQITPERYLVQFAKIPSTCRITRIEQLEGWHLFLDDESMNAFIAAIVKTDEPPAVKKKKTPRRKKAISKKTIARARDIANRD